jgi:methyl-accepting chemotaxis protein
MGRTSIKNKLILSFLALLLIVAVVLGVVNHMAEDFYMAQAVSTAIALAGGILFGSVLSRSILVRLKSLISAAKEISQGNLSREIPLVSTDEIRDLEEVFILMVSDLRKMLTEMKNVFQEIRGTSRTLGNLVRKVVATSAEIDRAARAIAKVSGDQTLIVQKTSIVFDNGLMSMGEMVRQTSQTVAKVNEARLKTEAGEAKAMETLRRLDDVLQEMTEYTQPIYRLANKVEKIKLVVGIMNGIAQKTDILSLNASIEATRAGEAGKGFALVADEIRSMAEGSKKSSEEIRDMIEDILEENRSVVEAINRSQEKMKSGRAVIHDIVATFGDMLSGVKEISGEIKQTEGVTARQVAEMKGILTHFQSLSKLASENFVATQKTTLATRDQKGDMVKIFKAMKALDTLSENMMKTQQRFNLGENAGWNGSPSK